MTLIMKKSDQKPLHSEQNHAVKISHDIMASFTFCPSANIFNDPNKCGFFCWKMLNNGHVYPLPVLRTKKTTEKHKTHKKSYDANKYINQ